MPSEVLEHVGSCTCARPLKEIHHLFRIPGHTKFLFLDSNKPRGSSSKEVILEGVESNLQSKEDPYQSGIRIKEAKGLLRGQFTSARPKKIQDNDGREHFRCVKEQICEVLDLLPTVGPAHTIAGKLLTELDCEDNGLPCPFCEQLNAWIVESMDPIDHPIPFFD
ncbi:hypothetical protein M9H77_35492 [Catharanthus roseus]|uniref:Uncharacterized protein n=1 Tax=Catharanthus roseus TaxID=4058 RepID=A0ACB9ZTF1_CATRO|nr:hypothetical protein M9H77_35492 [Catharanthus roseus]